MKKNPSDIILIGKAIQSLLILVMLLLVLMVAAITAMVVNPATVRAWFSSPTKDESISQTTSIIESGFWKAPDASTIPTGIEGEEIKYGRELIANTSKFLGPKGSVKTISNGMNCQNCHLEAGTKTFGNNYSAVSSTYPKFRPRSGTQETIEKRVNDCFERSLNGQALPDESREMKAIVAYIHWLGTDVPKGETPKGSGLVALEFLDRAAKVSIGKNLYEEKCTVCHGKDGTGILNEDGTTWTYPPLWGDKSYNTGAGLYRLSFFARYIKANMPLGATHDAPMLTDEEAWDIAAYVNSLPRPSKDLSTDWPDISKKPIDHPFGPFTDGFTDDQHKLGPFKPIQAKRKKLSDQKTSQ